MGHAAEFIADEFDVTREAMDRYALCSHQKAVAAQDAGRFRREIVAIDAPARKGGTVRISEDEPPRRDTSLEALARLAPAFRPEGRVTAGNAPGLNDAAAAVVVASRRKADAIGSLRWRASPDTRRWRCRRSTSSRRRPKRSGSC